MSNEIIGQAVEDIRKGQLCDFDLNTGNLSVTNVNGKEMVEKTGEEIEIYKHNYGDRILFCKAKKDKIDDRYYLVE